MQIAAVTPTVIHNVPRHGEAGTVPRPSPDGVEESIEAVDKVAEKRDGGTRTTHRTAASPEQQLSPEQQREVQQLQNRDREVKAHEAAHMAAAAGLVRGGMSFSYQTGPDGRRYAVGGEVSIDSSAVAGDPQATIEKARQIQAAALAPAEPSGQDRAVAASAARMAAEARVELIEQRRAEADESPVNVSTRSALDAYRSEARPDQASVLDQTV